MEKEKLPAHPLLGNAVKLLQRLVSVPSTSRQEEETASLWQAWLRQNGAGDVRRIHNNVYAVAQGYSPKRPTLLLNSHHDTVKPAKAYTRDPYAPTIEDDRLYGLGSNDAGASGVALACTFLIWQKRLRVPFNLVFAITAEEEVGGEKGMRSFLPTLKEEGIEPDMAIVGEPTGMQPAVAERGLLVLDCETPGVSGHAARNEGVNAIYRAMEDISLLRNFKEESPSEVLGPLKVSVTMIEGGTQHNVVPDKCRFVVDVRTTDAMSNEQTVEKLREIVKYSKLTPRSTRVHASVMEESHPLVQAALKMGMRPFVSPTTSDMSLMHGLPSLKIGPGESSRSHTADEYVLISEINGALHQYTRLLENLCIELN